MARLPAPLQAQVEKLARAYFAAPGLAPIEFSAPVGAPALFAPDSVTWRVMKNPVALFVGGVAAVLLELAEPRVRTGVWEHTSFRADPVGRMKRTGFAAMVTIYAPAETARLMIARVNRAHALIAGATPAGVPFRADDPELLNWVQATASFGFVEAYRRYCRALPKPEVDQFYAEAAPVAALYGATGAPRNAAAMEALLATMRPSLEPSPIIPEFLNIVRRAPALPSRFAQALLIEAAVALLPEHLRTLLALASRFSPASQLLVRALGAAAERIVIGSAPPAQACVRLGLRADYLYR
jgi:uncharacterized protein (DUF2236 family)